MDVDRILEQNKKLVNRKLKRFLPSKADRKWVERLIGPANYDQKAVSESLTKPTWDLLERGGKRWRPLLMFLACEAVGGNAGKISRFSVIPELIHNGTLVADDMEDNSAQRRGKPAIHVKYGTDTAVNLSSMLYFLPLTIIRDSRLDTTTKTKLYEDINNELLRLHFGQGTDIQWHKIKNEKVKESQYFAMCANKTGTLARLSARMGAILGNAKEEQTTAIGKFAESLGIAFQIQDDILNLKGGLGKETGEDITEGKMSLPVIRTLSAGKKGARKELLKILRKHSREEGEIKQAIGIMESQGSIEYSREKAEAMVNRAWNTLEPLLAETRAKKNLEALARFMTKRSN